MTRFIPAALAVALAAPALATPAHAATSDSAPSRLVSYADLDLAHPADQARLERRIANAARGVCKTDDPVLRARCLSNARAGAEPQMQRAITRAAVGGRLASATAPVVGN